MSFSAIYTFIQRIFRHVPVSHWVAIGTLTWALIVILLIRKKCSVYSAICLGILVFWGVFMLDATVVNRFLGSLPQETGFDFSIRRFLHSTEQGRIELLANIIAFVPFGFLLSEFMSTTKRILPWRRTSYTVLIAFTLSLCIECLQLLLRVGHFELTDLVMNTVGASLGVGTSLLIRRFLRIFRSRMTNS